MKFIKKQEKEPDFLIKWKLQFDLDIKIADANIENKELWKRFMGTKVSDKLKKFLIAEQFGICCYCGQKLREKRKTSGDNDSNDNQLESNIEHLKDKQKNRNDVLNYRNLLASCSGVITNKVSLPFKQGETPEDVILSQGFSAIEYRVIKNENNVLIIRKVLQQCNNKKDSNEIKIHPLQNDCEKKFEYELLTGKIKGLDDDAKETADILGLGTDTYENSYLEERRLSAINEAYTTLIMRATDPTESIDYSFIAQAPFAFWEDQVKKKLSPDQLTSLAQELYDLEYLPNSEGQIERFPFVRRYVYKNEGDLKEN